MRHGRRRWEFLQLRCSLLEAVERADALVGAREQAEDFTPSEPQTFVGAKMRVKLDELALRGPPEVKSATAD